MKNLKYIIYATVSICMLFASFSYADLASNSNEANEIIAVGQIAEGFQFIVTSPQTSCSQSSSVYLDVRFINTTNNDLKLLYPAQVEDLLNITVLDTSGKPTPLTAFGARSYVKPDFTQLYHPYTGPIRIIYPSTLRAHQEIHYRILLSRIYDLTNQGSYVVSVSQWVAKENNQGVVTLTSKPITISIQSDDNSVMTPLNTNPAQDSGQPSIPIGQTF